MARSKAKVTEKGSSKIENIYRFKKVIKNYFFLAFAVTLLGFWAVTSDKISTTTDWIGNAITLAIGILTFNTIFYSFIYEPWFRNMQQYVRDVLTRDDRKTLIRKLEEMIRILQGRDLVKLGEISEDLGSSSRLIGLYIKDTDLLGPLKWSTLYLLIAAVTIFNSSIIAPFDLIPMTRLTVRSIGFGFLLAGVYYSIKILIIVFFMMTLRYGSKT
jgi:hypothetical protein